MTIIAVRNNIMSCDSLVIDGDTKCGEVRKFRRYNNGWIAACGALSFTIRLMDEFTNEGSIELSKQSDFHDVMLLRLEYDGRVLEGYAGVWYEISAPFHAIGSGAPFALGAMAAGADAPTAVSIACSLSTSCGGDIHLLKQDHHQSIIFESNKNAND